MNLVIIIGISGSLFYSLSVISKSLLCLVHVSNDFSVYATFLVVFIIFFLQVKNITMD
jgi:hypothetical protein